jgi:hypothetical protein
MPQALIEGEQSAAEMAQLARGRLRRNKILLAVYHIMTSGSDYQELGPTYLDRIDQRRTAGQLTRRLRASGYDVDIKLRAA